MGERGVGFVSQDEVWGATVKVEVMASGVTRSGMPAVGAVRPGVAVVAALGGVLLEVVGQGVGSGAVGSGIVAAGVAMPGGVLLGAVGWGAPSGVLALGVVAPGVWELGVVVLGGMALEVVASGVAALGVVAR